MWEIAQGSILRYNILDQNKPQAVPSLDYWKITDLKDLYVTSWTSWRAVLIFTNDKKLTQNFKLIVP